MSEKFSESLKTVDHYDELAPIRLWVGNLGLYNEGYLVGEWISLPADDNEIAAMYERVGVADEHNTDEYGTVYEETIFCDYECDIPGYSLNECGNIDEYNEVAAWWADLDEYDAAIVAARLDNGESISCLMGTRYPSDGAWACKCDNESDAAAIYIDEIGGLSNLSNEVLLACFDFDYYARYYCNFHEVEIDGTTYQVDLYD